MPNKIVVSFLVLIVVLGISAKTVSAETYDNDIFDSDYTVQEGQTMTVDNDDLNLQGDIVIEYGGELILNGSCYSTGTITVEEGGVLTINNTFDNVGEITVEEGGTFELNSTFTNNGELINYATVDLNDDFINYYYIFNYSQINIQSEAELSNSGNIDGCGSLMIDGKFENSGTYESGYIENSGVVKNTGDITVEESIIKNIYKFANKEDGTLTLSETSFYNEGDAAEFVNDGTVDSTDNSKIYNNGVITNNSTMDVYNVSNYNEVDNDGTFTIYGTFDSTQGVLTNYSVVNNGGIMLFTYFSDFIQSEDAEFAGNSYECEYSYGATAIFNGNVIGYVIVVISVLIICGVVKKVKRIKKEKD